MLKEDEIYVTFYIAQLLVKKNIIFDTKHSYYVGDGSNGLQLGDFVNHPAYSDDFIPAPTINAVLDLLMINYDLFIDMIPQYDFIDGLVWKGEIIRLKNPITRIVGGTNSKYSTDYYEKLCDLIYYCYMELVDFDEEQINEKFKLTININQ